MQDSNLTSKQKRYRIAITASRGPRSDELLLRQIYAVTAAGAIVELVQLPPGIQGNEIAGVYIDEVTHVRQ